MIRIVTDSTCDLPEAELERHRILVVPINVQFGQESYQEGITLSRSAFYEKVDALNMIPTTSQPSLGQFQQAYRLAAAEPDTEGVLSLHITSHLSGTYDSAVVAASQMTEAPPIQVFDSLSGSMGLGFMVLEAAHLAESGGSAAEILARLAVLRERMLIFFSLNDLRYARMSGRVGISKALLTSLLHIKPMLTDREGRLALLQRVRSQAQALARLVDILVEALEDAGSTDLSERGPARIAVIHASAPELGEQLRDKLAKRLRTTEILVQELSMGIAVHFGPRTVGVVGYKPSL